MRSDYRSSGVITGTDIDTELQPRRKILGYKILIQITVPDTDTEHVLWSRTETRCGKVTVTDTVDRPRGGFSDTNSDARCRVRPKCLTGKNRFFSPGKRTDSD